MKNSGLGFLGFGAGLFFLVVLVWLVVAVLLVLGGLGEGVCVWGFPTTFPFPLQT